MNTYIRLVISKISFGLLIACSFNTLGQPLLLTGPPVVKAAVSQELTNVKGHVKIKSVHPDHGNANKKNRLIYRLPKIKVHSFRSPLANYKPDNIYNPWNLANSKVFFFEEAKEKGNLAIENAENFPLQNSAERNRSLSNLP